jgi:hypothetical protein
LTGVVWSNENSAIAIVDGPIYLKALALGFGAERFLFMDGKGVVPTVAPS